MTYSIQDAARYLSVTPATIQNWIRQQLILPDHTNQISFDQLTKLKRDIQSGVIKRLNKRANKTATQHQTIHREYVSSKKVLKQIHTFMNQLPIKILSRSEILFHLAINIVTQKYQIPKNLSIPEFQKMLPNELFRLIDQWYQKLKTPPYNQKIKNLILPDQSDDLLGIIYLSLLSRGEKQSDGNFYTPYSITQAIVTDYAKPTDQILDFCCGTGQFLITTALSHKNKIKHLSGIDIDPIAVIIAKLNLLLINPHHKPNIQTADTLLDHNDQKFDLIMSNPPWGKKFSHTQKEKLKKRYPDIPITESFSLFIYRGMLKPGGILSLILPESILKVKGHRWIRQFILTHTTLLKITPLEKPFQGIFSKVIRMDLIKKKSDETDYLTIQFPAYCERIRQELFFDSKNNYRFTIDLSTNDHPIIQKIKCAQLSTLGSHITKWAIGVVSGNNRYFISDRPKTDFDPVITGQEVFPYHILPTNKFILFDQKRLQQVAPEQYYRHKPKLIYRFIATHPIVAIDHSGDTTLNSANIMIPEKRDIYILLALLNSPLYQYYFKKMIGTLKILKSDLSILPIPLLTKKTHKQVTTLVRSYINSPKKSLLKKINQMVYALFNITPKEIIYIEEEIHFK